MSQCFYFSCTHGAADCGYLFLTLNHLSRAVSIGQIFAFADAVVFARSDQYLQVNASKSSFWSITDTSQYPYKNTTVQYA